MDNRLDNLKRILLKGFKGLKFTQLETAAFQPLKDLYRDSFQPFELEQKVHLNQIVSSAIHNLISKFSINI